MTSPPTPGMTVHALGTGGGPIVSSSRAGTSTAVTVDGATYVIDAGMGSIRNYRSHSSWAALRAVLLTHHHSDHLYDLGAYLVTGWEVPGESFSRPVRVLGPGPASVGTEGRTTSATTEIVEALLGTVFASDVAVRREDERRGDPRAWILAEDIAVPGGAGADEATRHPETEPFEVYRDELVSITAALVDHRLCYPAFAFRVDSRYGSVVVSGDTAPSPNLVRLARGADLLLHEVIDLDSILATFPDGPARAGIEVHLRESHTPYSEVGKVAAGAGVGELVLHHIVPNTPGAADLAAILAGARADFAGPVRIAEDNDVFRVGTQGEAAGVVRHELAGSNA
ncbi:MBL fold metallo-hydrolase [Sinomonas atrocyanea]|uniref:MBL fold metallo-hydrolase n=1 Tax=Sinomonas atrocyanea TaxID=37927 RepID=UPI003D9953A0